ncbi:hypothetical protein H1R20_g16580, partial [Candolleomyces eurysporus]
MPKNTATSKRLRTPDGMKSQQSKDAGTISPTKKTWTLMSYGFEPASKMPELAVKLEEPEDSKQALKNITEGLGTSCKNGGSADADIRHLVLKGGLKAENLIQLGQITYDKVLHELSRYHLDGDQLMGQMKELKVYISGSFPLSITHPTVVSNDLDLYVNQYQSSKLVEFLAGKGYGQPTVLGKEEVKRNKGYKDDVGKGAVLTRSTHNGITSVLAMEHKDGGCINVVITEASPLQVIPLFHSTVVMNYIAAHGFVMLYPKLTMNNMGIINSGGKLTSKLEGCISKYRKRGFTITRGYPSTVPRSHTCGIDKSCPQTIRHLQDSEILHIPFPSYTGEDPGKLRELHDAKKCVWQLASGPFCTKGTTDKHGFSLVDTYASLKLKGE